MECPKCHGEMLTKHFGAQIALQRCSQCHGIWCNSADLGALEDIPMIDILDDGDHHVGALYNRIVDINCPNCATPMTNNRVPDQPHITVETCSTCTGVFLDAGELRDAKHHTLGDWIKRVKIALSGGQS